jgi:hypothetical protein
MQFTQESRENLSNQQHAISVCEIPPLYRIHSQQLRHSNPEIRQSLGFFSPLFPAPSLCLARLAPNHPQKRRKMLVLGAAPRHVLPVFSKRRLLMKCCQNQVFKVATAFTICRIIFSLSVTGLDATTKILFCPSVVVSGDLSVRIIIILFSSVRRPKFHVARDFFRNVERN